jgi:hypothetical protein
MNQEADIRKVIELYTQGTFEGDAEKLNASFHEKAVMNGYLGGQLLMATPDVFITEICKSPMNQTDFNYSPIVTELSIEDKVATVTLIETYPDGMSFTNYFHLIDDGNGWKIISKTFTSR